MEMTKHATERSCKRNISNFALKIVKESGRVIHTKRGAVKIFFGTKESNQIVKNLKNIITQIERANGTAIVVNENSVPTTFCFHQI